ncbi:MAG: hypothetical protein ACLVKO_09215 [Dysgonomonas sp.]
MKKILFMLLAALPLAFAACGDDDKTKEPEPVYIDPGTIAGDWYRIEFADSTVYQFRNGTSTRITYDKYSKSIIGKIEWGEYRLTKEKIIYIYGNPKRGC